MRELDIATLQRMARVLFLFFFFSCLPGLCYRHESRRVDNQLRGRSGRQGDPGSSRFFLSLEDNLFRVFGGDNIQKMMSVFNLDDVPIESSMLSNSLDTAQKRVETYFYDIRKNLYEYDQVF